MTRPSILLPALGLLLVLAGAPLLAWAGGPSYPLLVVTRGAVVAVAALSLQFMLGFGGLVSFGHAAVMGIGAYAVLAADGQDLVVVLPLAMAAAALFTGLTGLVSLRTGGVTYIMITLAFGQMAYFVAQAWAPLGGDDGMALDARSPLFGTAVLGGRYGFHACVAVALIAWFLVLRMLALSPFGRALRASSGNPARVTALGFDVFRLRLAASAIAGAGGGLSGALLANASEFVSPAVLEWRASGHMLVMVILGGRLAALTPMGRTIEGQLLATVLAAMGLIAAEEALAIQGQHGALILGPALVLAALAGGRR